jgi:uncharacterized protein YebE (UPF0316 family)
MTFTKEAWLAAGLIFSLRLLNTAVATFRMMMTARGRSNLSVVLSFFEAILYVFTLTFVVSDLNNWLSITAYALGYALGNFTGQWIDRKLAIGHMLLQVITSTHSISLTKALRDAGFAVTEIDARGKDGAVTVLKVGVMRKNQEKVREIVTSIDPSAFVTAESMTPMSRGFWGNP